MDDFTKNLIRERYEAALNEMIKKEEKGLTITFRLNLAKSLILVSIMIAYLLLLAFAILQSKATTWLSISIIAGYFGIFTFVMFVIFRLYKGMYLNKRYLPHRQFKLLLEKTISPKNRYYDRKLLLAYYNKGGMVIVNWTDELLEMINKDICEWINAKELDYSNQLDVIIGVVRNKN